MSKDIENKESRKILTTSLSPEAYSLLEAEALREEKDMGVILDKLILEGCNVDEGLPLESHFSDIKKSNEIPKPQFDKFNPI